MQNYSKFRSPIIWIPSLLVILCTFGIIQFFVSSHNSQERFIASTQNVSNLLDAYGVLPGFNMETSVQPQSSCKESNYNSLSLNHHFICTTGAGAILTADSDVSRGIIKAQLTSILTQQQANMQLHEGGSTTDSLFSDLATNKHWYQGFSIGEQNTSVALYLAAPDDKSVPTNYNFGGAVGTKITEQLIKLWTSNQNDDKYTLLVYIEDSPYDSCTSFFLPICAAHLRSSK